MISGLPTSSLGQLPGLGSGSLTSALDGGNSDMSSAAGGGGAQAPALSGMGQLPGATTSGNDISSAISGLAPNSATGGQSFADVLKQMVLTNPSQAQFQADQLAATAAAGGNVDPATLARETAIAGVDIQMSTRTISSAVSAVKMLMQMQL